MKKKLTLALSLLIVVAIAVGGTLAYFNVSTDSITNEFTVGKNVEIELKDEYTHTDSYHPGDEIPKEVGIINAASSTEGTHVFAAVTAKFEYKMPEFYKKADGSFYTNASGKKLQVYSKIITPEAYAALDAAEQAEYVLIDDPNNDYCGFYTEITAVTTTYYLHDKDHPEDPSLDFTKTVPGDPVPVDLVDGIIYKRTSSYTAGEPKFSENFITASYGNPNDPLWSIASLEYKDDAGNLHPGINPDWEYIGDNAEGEAVFVYKEILKPTKESNVFSAVKIAEDIDYSECGPFNITVKGYAVQAEGDLLNGTASEAIVTAFPALAPV